MLADIISIGDELLIGQVVNTNATWIAQQLSNIGIEVRQIITVADNKQDILFSLNNAVQQSEIVIITGGLGPTKDDITKHTLCEYFNTHLINNADVLEDVKKMFAVRNLQLTELNTLQAQVPANCQVIRNNCGTAPGMWFTKQVDKRETIVISLPGVPFEMQAMINNYVMPKLSALDQDKIIIFKTVLTSGIGESFLAEKIADWENELPQHIKLAYLPSPGMVKLRLTATGTIPKDLQNEIDELFNKLYKIIPEFIFGINEDKPEGVIAKLLQEKSFTLSTAESCTGGYIAHLLTSIPGSSVYYKGSVIAYSNEIKTKILNIEPTILEKHGAVSEATVRQMARNVQLYFQSDYSIATSGIAGPDGGTTDKPVGTVWIAVATPEEIITQKFIFSNDRIRNIQRTALSAFNILRQQLLTL